MAKLRLLGRLAGTTTAITMLSMVFSGGCTPSGSSQYGPNNFNTASGNQNRDYLGENSPGSYGSPSGYEDLAEWNFNSRMGNRPSASSNSGLSEPVANVADVSVLPSGSSAGSASVGADTASRVRTYRYLNPSDPKADKDGFVTLTIPENTQFYEEPSAPAVNSRESELARPVPSVAGANQPGYYNTLDNSVANPGYAPVNNWQNPAQQPAAQTSYYQPQQPIIQPGRITSIDINGIDESGSYSPLHSSIPQINYTNSNPQNTFTSTNVGSGQPTVQKPIAYEAGYALPRINSGSVETSSQPNVLTSIPITYTTSNSNINPGTRTALPPVNSAIANTNTNTTAALAQYNMMPQVGNVDDLAVNLEKLLAKDPDNLDLQMALRYAYAAQGDYDKALQELSVIPIDNQRKSIALARATILSSRLENTNDPMVANSALSAIKILQDKVAGKADLKISTFKVCSKVDNFGQYQELAPGSLESGNACEVIVYCELENYQYQLNDNGQYFTSLHAEITLFDSSLNALQQISEDVVDTPSYNKRKDFFLRGPFKLPQLRPGKYQIVISMEDKIAGKRALAARYQFEVKGTSSSPDATSSVLTAGSSTY